MSPIILVGILLVTIIVIIVAMHANKKAPVAAEATAKTAEIIAASPAVAVDNVAVGDTVSTVINTPTTTSVVTPEVPIPETPAQAAEVVTASGGILGTGKFILIARRGPSLDVNSPEGEAVSFAEIKVTGPDGASVLSGAAAIAGSNLLDKYPVHNIMDGNLSTFTHTVTATPRDNYDGANVIILFPEERKISSIVLTNRVDCCKNRAVGITVSIINGNGWPEYISPPIADVKDTYTFSASA